MNLYKSIYLEPPFEEWGYYRTLTLPVWRLADPDCNLAVRVEGRWIKSTLTCIETWGFTFKKVTPFKQSLIVWSQSGDPPTPDWENQSSPIVALRALPGPRLLMNTTRQYGGWQHWKIYGWPRIDPYVYPLRQNYVEVNYELASLVLEAKEAHQQGTLWRFRVGDVINQMVEQGITKKEAIKLVKQATGLSYIVLDQAALVADRIPLDQRGSSISWRKYMQLANVGSVQHDKKATRLGSGSGEVT